MQPNQRTRLAFLSAYVILLGGTSWVAFDSFIPPTSAKGLWFYSGLGALVLGSLLVSPYFTKPSDALANGVAAMFSLLAVKTAIAQAPLRFDHHLYWAVISFALLVIVLAIVAIALKDVESATWQKVGKTCFYFAESLGAPSVIYSLLVITSLILFHRESPREYITISVAWIVIFVVQPLEGLWALRYRIHELWRPGTGSVPFGEVLAHQLPRLILLRHPLNVKAGFGDLLYTSAPDGVPMVVMALDHIASSEGQWLRGLQIVMSSEEAAALAQLERPVTSGCSKLGVESASCLSGNHVFKRKHRLVGVVAPGTTVERLLFEVMRDDLDLETGRLVEVRVGKSTVLYQVVNGVTKEEIVQQRHSRGYVIGEAVKIGCWNQAKLSFDPVNWVPLPNETVFIIADATYETRADSVGHFPRTSYPLQIDVGQLVTHNAAILGVLGSGKSFLALELIERMAAAGIKTVCLDLTDQYAQELAPFINNDAQQARMAELQSIGLAGKTKVSKNVEEGGSVIPFRNKLREQFAAFFDAQEEPVLILNPAALEIWKQDSRPFQDTASMATLSPAEITRIISEVLLEVLQAKGMTALARCCLVLEEAHSLVPEWNAVAVEGDKSATNGTAKALLQGRKFGLGCLLVTQRTANVTKTILNQCNTIFALRSYDETAARFLADYIGTNYAGVLPSLEDRNAVIYGRASSCKNPILVRLNDRESFVLWFREGGTAAPTVAA